MRAATLLDDRGVIEVSGEDAGKFLHGLVTNDLLSLEQGDARYAALLSPQGKILFDFLVFARDADTFLIDCPAASAPDLEKRLNIYRLRAKARIVNRSASYVVIAFPDAVSAPRIEGVICARDPRADFGFRAIAPRGVVDATDDRSAYDAARIRAGLPAGGEDFAWGEVFPHDANMDLLNGVDFGKGCYVGQEVVSRMKHRGAARRRIVRYRAEGAAPPPGSPINAGDIALGVCGSRNGDVGLAMIRLDRLTEARALGATPVADGVTLDFPEKSD
jgi:folate-binding protein YgfZ